MKFYEKFHTCTKIEHLTKIPIINYDAIITPNKIGNNSLIPLNNQSKIKFSQLQLQLCWLYCQVTSQLNQGDQTYQVSQDTGLLVLQPGKLKHLVTLLSAVDSVRSVLLIKYISLSLSNQICSPRTSDSVRGKIVYQLWEFHSEGV